MKIMKALPCTTNNHEYIALYSTMARWRSSWLSSCRLAGWLAGLAGWPTSQLEDDAKNAPCQNKSFHVRNEIG